MLHPWIVEKCRFLGVFRILHEAALGKGEPNMINVSNLIANQSNVSKPFRFRILVTHAILFVIGLKILLIGYFLINNEFLPNLLNRTPMFTFKIPERGSRILIFSPHPDDETMGCASLVQKAVRNGCQLKVVVVTNGDGIGVFDGVIYMFGQPKPADFIKTGYLRQNETKQALAAMGISEKDIIFLGYPDRGSRNLWRDNWDADKPFTSPSTKYNHSVYHNTFTPKAKYTGINLANDIETVIRQFKPTHIIYPHFYDGHVDHFSTNNFVKYAIAKLDLNVKEITYLIHRGNWPVPPGEFSNLYLYPPQALENCGIKWYSLSLSNDDLKEKAKSVRSYKSQMDKWLMKGYLFSFIRKNELFGEYGNIEICVGGREIYPGRVEVINFRNPFADSLDSYLNKPADIYGLSLVFNDSLSNDTLNCKIRTLEKPRADYKYLLDLIFFNEDNTTKRAILTVQNGELRINKLTKDSIDLPEQATCRFGQNYVNISFPLEYSDGMRSIFISASTFKNEQLIDRTGSRLIKIKGYN
jgi:LmbE family N-acetylglucosaminyl deacetylase